MTAEKVTDVTARLPGCAGQAADETSAYTQAKMEDASLLLKKIRSHNVQIFGYVYQNTNGQNHGPAWKAQSFLLSEICTVIFWQDHYGKGNSTKVYWNMDGRKFQIGNVSSLIEKKTILVCVCGR